MSIEVPIEFDQKRIYALAQAVWKAKNKRLTEVDHQYFDPQDEDFGEMPLPCLELRICPFGVYLTGNGDVPEHLDIWADGYNPMDEPDAERLEGKIATDFVRTEFVLHFHITDQPADGMQFQLCYDRGMKSFGYFIDMTPVIMARIKAFENQPDCPNYAQLKELGLQRL